MSELTAAIQNRDWPVALEAALAQWREHRTIAFGSLVAVIGRHVADHDLEAGELDRDRVARLLARPEDPRVAMRLADHLVTYPDDPDATSISQRIVALRDSLAIAKVMSSVSRFDRPIQHAFTLAGSTARGDADEAARQWIRQLCDPDGAIEALWQAVVEEPGDVERRLVLADALIEQGDPRGQLIALQCRPGGGEDAARLLEARRYEMLGELALVIADSSTFRSGFLFSVGVGKSITPPTGWELSRSRELCAVHDMSPGYASPWHYAQFLAGLSRMPAWVRVERAHLDELRKLGVACPFRNVELSLYPAPRDLRAELLGVVAYAPAVEGLAFRVSHWPPLATCIEVVREVRERVPSLRRFVVGLLSGHGNDEAIVEAARELDFMELVEEPAILGAWD